MDMKSMGNEHLEKTELYLKIISPLAKFIGFIIFGFYFWTLNTKLTEVSIESEIHQNNKNHKEFWEDFAEENDMQVSIRNAIRTELMKTLDLKEMQDAIKHENSIQKFNSIIPIKLNSLNETKIAFKLHEARSQVQRGHLRTLIFINKHKSIIEQLHPTYLSLLIDSYNDFTEWKISTLDLIKDTEDLWLELAKTKYIEIANEDIIKEYNRLSDKSQALGSRIGHLKTPPLCEVFLRLNLENLGLKYIHIQ